MATPAERVPPAYGTGAWASNLPPRVQVPLAAALFSTGGAAIKWCTFGAFQLGTFRALIAGAAILVLVPAARRGWSWRAALVGIAYAMTTLLFVLANKLTTAANAIFLQSTSPVFVLLLAPLLIREPVRRADVVQLIVTAGGMALVFAGADQPVATAPDPRLGNLVAAACAITWSFTLIGYRWLATRGTSPAAAAVIGNGLAGVAALALGWPFAAGRWSDWAAVTYLGVFQLALPYVFLAYAIPRLRALEVALLLLLEPVLNPVWAWLVHGETPSGWALAGGAVILGATAARVVSARASRPGRGDDRTA
jgi:drug/metabolite transporter (DMT)-like permease